MEEGRFDYKQVTEDEEKLDFNKKINCPNCKKPIPQNALMCYYCGSSVSQPQKASRLIWAAIVMVIIFVAFMILSYK